jgi:hypothetical protein
VDDDAIGKAKIFYGARWRRAALMRCGFVKRSPMSTRSFGQSSVPINWGII